jgi:ABC-2 type transport system ATP-binding protein
MISTSQAIPQVQRRLSSALQIQGLGKSFGTNSVLHDLSLSVDAGSVCGVIGSNGSGKTTLLRCLSGLEKPDTGVIRLFSESFTESSFALKRKLGLMPEHSAIVDYLTVREFLLFSGELYGLKASTLQPAIQRLMVHLDLPQNSRTLIRTCSTGTRKKLGFAAAVLHSPEVLLLDEPFESVEPQTVAWMKRYLRDFVFAGGAVLVVSHMLDTLDKVCDHIAILQEGTIIWDGARAADGTSAYTVGSRSFDTLEELYLEIIQGSDHYV